MEIVRDLAIVLKAIRFQERHQIISALTEHHGKITVIAQNSVHSRRFGGALDLFSAGDWIYRVKPHSNLFVLQEAVARESFLHISRDFQRLAYASTFNEVLIMIEAGAEHSQGLFRHHAHALSLLQSFSFPEDTLSGLILLNLYLLKILIWSGNVPQLEECLKCGKTWSKLDPYSRVKGNIMQAGWTCSSCDFERKTNDIPSQVLQDILCRVRQPLKVALKNVEGTPSEYEKFLHFLEAFFMFHIPGFDQKPLKSLKFISKQAPPV